ncbi:hypothetical protein B0H16DRAFT_1483041 [Mycena metata]|uniref:Uncharacterized protein n=1 Tax=Mycena metata TaxID=1033252 RepID=A0AAD7GNI2_9AGAR|nr:hypothetical protein B0H16DRAFT_1483041 [Mycena metata]
MSSVPITQTSDLLPKLHSILPPATGSRMEPSLRALWVSQVRNLCQGIHETIGGRIFTDFPAPLRNELRIAVKILLLNIILIGAMKTSVESDPSNPAQYYVPGFGTLIFTMAEQFVILCGYEGDEDVPSREGIFSAVALIQHAMVIHPDYVSTPVEAPGYSSAQTDPFFYGVGLPPPTCSPEERIFSVTTPSLQAFRSFRMARVVASARPPLRYVSLVEI